MLGISSKELNAMTEKRNRKNRLLKIREHCGFKIYLQLTSNGYQIFSSSIRDPIRNYNYRVTQTEFEFLKEETLCVRALENNIHDISDKLTELHISVPIINVDVSPELESALNSYFAALDSLFIKKSSFQKMSIVNIHKSLHHISQEYLRQDVEIRIFNQLSQLTINHIEIQVKLRNPQLFVNPSIKKLSAHQQFFTMSNFPVFSNLSSIIFPEFDWVHSDINRRASNLLSFTTH